MSNEPSHINRVPVPMMSINTNHQHNVDGRSESTWPSLHGRSATQRKARIDDSTVERDHSQPPDRADTGAYSEHGHNLTKIRPLAKHSGSSVGKFFNGLFTTIIALATLGTSITFSFILSDTVPPPEGNPYDIDAVQFFLAVSWLLFLLDLAFASLGSTLMTFFGHHWSKDWDGEHGKKSQLEVQLYAVGVSAIMASLTLAAFVFMCLVVVAYQPAVGWASLGFTAVFGIIMVLSIFNQVPWPWIKPRTPSMPHSEEQILA